MRRKIITTITGLALVAVTATGCATAGKAAVGAGVGAGAGALIGAGLNDENRSEGAKKGALTPRSPSPCVLVRNFQGGVRSQRSGPATGISGEQGPSNRLTHGQRHGGG